MVIVSWVCHHKPVDAEPPAMLLTLCLGVNVVFVKLLFENLLEIYPKGIGIWEGPVGSPGLFIGGRFDV